MLKILFKTTIVTIRLNSRLVERLFFRARRAGSREGRRGERKCSFTQFWHNGVFVKYFVVIVGARSLARPLAFPSFFNSESSLHDATRNSPCMAIQGQLGVGKKARSVDGSINTPLWTKLLFCKNCDEIILQILLTNIFEVSQ